MAFKLYLLFLLWAFLRPLEFFAPELEFLRIMLWLSLAALTGALVGEREEISRKAGQIGMLLAFLAAIALSLVMNHPSAIPGALIEFMPQAVLFFLTVVHVSDMSRWRATARLVATCAILLCAISVYSYHTGYMADRLIIKARTDASNAIPELESSVPAQDQSGLWLWRASSVGFLSDPNDFAQAILVFLPLLLTLPRPDRSWLRKVLMPGLPVALMLYTVFITKSRGGILGLGAVAFLYLQQRIGPVKALVLLGMPATLLVGGFGGRKFSAAEESAGGRIDAWSEGLQMLVNQPLFGVGYKLFSHDGYTAHNSFVLTFSELGLFGSFVWTGVLVLAYRSVSSVIRTAPEGSDEFRWAFALRASLVAFLVCALFLSRSYAANLWFLAAICIAYPECVRRNQPHPQPPPARIPWAGAAIAFAFASVVLTYLVVRLKNAGMLDF